MEEVLDRLVDGEDARNVRRILEIKKSFGDRLLILGHFYQRLPIVLLSDRVGDSFDLSSWAARAGRAEFIVFCGVSFMAESAGILRASHQRVYHPNPDAGCPMADMARADEVERAFTLVSERTGRRVVPVTYMNSGADVKAFCGRNGGLVCTSSNADRAFRWAYERGEVVLFVPDEHLGTNTADRMGIPEEARLLYDPSLPEGENEERISTRTRLVLWKGYCHVHTWFTPEDVRRARVTHPEAEVIVHPECPREVTALADGVGSTAFILRRVESAAPGSTLVVGTEINMVAYLQHRFGADKKILPLARSFCPNMFKIRISLLRETLENLSEDDFRVEVDPRTAEDARVALHRMLELA